MSDRGFGDGHYATTCKVWLNGERIIVQRI